ncbi:MAG: hypothetical protein R2729_10360 [Bryobacteraceae bacterium]
MMFGSFLRFGMLAAVAPCLMGSPDLDAVKAEPNLEKRSELALKNADLALDLARKAYSEGDRNSLDEALNEAIASLDLCQESLEESGRNARKKPKYFKKAEIGARKYLRRLDSFRNEMSVADRPTIEPVVERAHKLQEDILHAIMGKKK